MVMAELLTRGLDSLDMLEKPLQPKWPQRTVSLPHYCTQSLQAAVPCKHLGQSLTLLNAITNHWAGRIDESFRSLPSRSDWWVLIVTATYQTTVSLRAMNPPLNSQQHLHHHHHCHRYYDYNNYLSFIPLAHRRIGQRDHTTVRPYSRSSSSFGTHSNTLYRLR